MEGLWIRIPHNHILAQFCLLAKYGILTTYLKRKEKYHGIHQEYRYLGKLGLLSDRRQDPQAIFCVEYRGKYELRRFYPPVPTEISWHAAGQPLPLPYQSRQPSGNTTAEKRGVLLREAAGYGINCLDAAENALKRISPNTRYKYERITRNMAKKTVNIFRRISA